MYEELTPKVEKKLKLVAIQQACIDCTLHYIKRLVVDLSTKPKCDSMLALLKRYDKLGCVATAGKYKWKIKDLLKELNKSKEDLIAFGDEHNDTEMLSLAKSGYAMKNASEVLLPYADEQLDYTNEDDGVARKLEELLL